VKLYTILAINSSKKIKKFNYFF